MTKKVKGKLLWTAAAACLLLLMAAAGAGIAPHDPYQVNLDTALLPPGGDFPLGTDRYGRCVLSRVIAGARVSVLAALALVGCSVVVGGIVGMVGGWLGGRADNLLMRLADIFLSFPGLVFAIAVASMLGGGLASAVIALTCISWPKYARLMRSQVLQLKNEPYIRLAQFNGLRGTRLLVKYILPVAVRPLLIMGSSDLGTMLLELAGMSFLGLGVQPPEAEWGLMMAGGRSLLQLAPWALFAPGAAIFITVSVFNLLGDALRDALAPQQSID